MTPGYVTENVSQCVLHKQVTKFTYKAKQNASLHFEELFISFECLKAIIFSKSWLADGAAAVSLDIFY